MAVQRKTSEAPGLPSLNEARAARRRSIVLGRARIAGIPPQFWLWVGVALAAFFTLYWRWAQGELERAKAAVMAKQRAMHQTLGPRILPLQERAEQWVAELSGPWPGDRVEKGADLSRLKKQPGVYLRLRLKSAKKKDSLRTAASRSLLDGFTSCLFVRKTLDPTKGPACKSTADCDAGKLCNEWDVCTDPPQPYNMRLLYRALRVLSNDWTDELHQADSELGVSAYDRDLDSVTRHDVPIAIEVLSRAKYFTVVLDEDPKAGLPKALPDTRESEEERLQRVPHWARVGIFDLVSGETLLRVRRQAAGKLVQVGPRQQSEGVNLFAQQRQANSCTLALQVKHAMANGHTSSDKPGETQPASEGRPTGDGTASEETAEP